MSIFAIVTVIFIVLKALEIGEPATWSWWLCFLPIMIPGIVWGLFIAIGALLVWLSDIKQRRSYGKAKR